MSITRKICLLLTLLCVFIIPSALQEENTLLYQNSREVFDTIEGEKDKILLSFLGDMTIGCNVYNHTKDRSIIHYVNQNGYAYPFEKVHHVLSQDDLTIGNFEGVLHNSEKGINKKTYNFRAPTDFVNVLTKGSVEAVTLGNNHTSDYKKQGFESTINTFNDNGVEWFANTEYSDKSYIYQKDGVKIGFVGVYISYFWKEHEKVRATIQTLKDENVDVIIAVMHGGVEYDLRHDKWQERLALRLQECGVDIIVGHHPHRLQGYEVIENTPVFYSLGNFVFGGNFKLRSTYTAVLQFALSFDADNKYMGYQVNILPCRLSTDNVQNFYQPYFIAGKEAQDAIKEIQVDTTKAHPLSDYIEGVGALQPYVPVK